MVRTRTRTQQQDTYYMISAAIVSLCSLIPSWVYAAVTRTGDYNTSFWHKYDGYIQGLPLDTPNAIRMRLYETALIVHCGFILSYFLCNLFQTAGLVHLIVVVVLILVSPGFFFGLMKQQPTIGDGNTLVKYAPATFTTNFAQVGCLFQTIWLAWLIMGSATIRFNNITMTRAVGLTIQIVCLCVCFGTSLGVSLGYNITGANSKWEEFYLIVGMICSFFIVLLIIFQFSERTKFINLPVMPIAMTVYVVTQLMQTLYRGHYVADWSGSEKSLDSSTCAMEILYPLFVLVPFGVYGVTRSYDKWCGLFFYCLMPFYDAQCTLFLYGVQKDAVLGIEITVPIVATAAFVVSVVLELKNIMFVDFFSLW